MFFLFFEWNFIRHLIQVFIIVMFFWVKNTNHLYSFTAFFFFWGGGGGVLGGKNAFPPPPPHTFLIGGQLPPCPPPLPAPMTHTQEHPHTPLQTPTPPPNTHTHTHTNNHEMHIKVTCSQSLLTTYNFSHFSKCKDKLLTLIVSYFPSLWIP